MHCRNHHSSGISSFEHFYELFTSYTESLSSPSTNEENISGEKLRTVPIWRAIGLPMGYRFSPSDAELVNHYLMNKILGKKMPAEVITELDVYSYEPDQLPIHEYLHGKVNEAYYFTHRDPKYLCGGEPRRTTLSGYWEASDEEHEVEYHNNIVGFKKTMVFYQGKEPNVEKTPWVMHEYRVNPSAIPAHELTNKLLSLVERFVVCRILFKGDDAYGYERMTAASIWCSQEESGLSEVEDNQIGTEDREDDASNREDTTGGSDE